MFFFDKKKFIGETFFLWNADQWNNFFICLVIKKTKGNVLQCESGSGSFETR